MRSARGFVLAVLVVTALTVAPATASAAAGLETTNGVAGALHGTQADWLNLNIGSAKVSCSTGEKPLTFEAAFSGSAHSVTTSSVTNPKCSGGSFLMNGCQLELDRANGSIGIGPAGCGSAKFVPGVCLGQSFSIPAGTDLDAEFENVGSGKEAAVLINLDDHEVEYTTGGGVCKGAGTYKDLVIEGVLKVTATNASKEPVGFRAISGDLYVGGSLEAPALEAPEYSTTVSGGAFESSQATLLEVGKAKVTCSGAAYGANEWKLTQPMSIFSLHATYSGCKSNIGSATVSTNSCEYLYSGFEYVAEDEYGSGAEIACNVGDAIKVSTGGCVINIPSQTLGGPTTMANVEVADEASIDLAMTAGGMKFTTQGANCVLLGIKAGSYENGSAASEMLLNGGI
jgi:hypothetical protein